MYLGGYVSDKTTPVSISIGGEFTWQKVCHRNNSHFCCVHAVTQRQGHSKVLKSGQANECVQSMSPSPPPPPPPPPPPANFGNFAALILVAFGTFSLVANTMQPEIMCLALPWTKIVYKSQFITLVLGKNAGAVFWISYEVVNSSLEVEYALVPTKLLYSPPAQSMLGTSLDTAGDEPIAKSGWAKTRPARPLRAT